MLTAAKLDLLCALARFLAPDQQSIDGANMAMCLSLFDGPRRSGRLAELRRQSRAKTLQGFQQYVMHAGLTESDNRALWADVDARLELGPFKADLYRIVPEAVIVSLDDWLCRPRRSRKRAKS